MTAAPLPVTVRAGDAFTLTDTLTTADQDTAYPAHPETYTMTAPFQPLRIVDQADPTCCRNCGGGLDTPGVRVTVRASPGVFHARWVEHRLHPLCWRLRFSPPARRAVSDTPGETL